MSKEIRISPIRNGTAIDHLGPGSAYKMLEVLDLRDYTVTVGINVESRKMGHKDIMFIEGRELSGKEMDKIALIGHGATVNLIKNSEIAEKFQLGYPEQVEGIMKCINPKCITNAENITGKFSIRHSPLEAKCFYCETRMGEQDIVSSIKSD
ncbi:MAG: aspartate carbamoyltransferase regulatory subunit [Candidatus Diapherotrites archaeon]|uniref:Aspartate carbamoyltransferase regulatory chain n=1 Tax=Candidatus Iainarchaeum sp. TaxID=3101447 RepID=A0A8T3YR24_9ARCH|nr:aspartate carbamoyltransferase regulatory subunit [Candidatus Diapherotrites archaeon]